MPIFTLPKKVEEIVAGVPLPVGWYKAKLVQEVELRSNKKKKEGLSEAEGAGETLALNLRVVSEDPEINGRSFTKYLPWPNDTDEELRMPRSGQKKSDWKMDVIVDWTEAFNNEEVEGRDISFVVGSEAFVYVEQQMVDGNPENDLSMNIKPKSLDEFSENRSDPIAEEFSEPVEEGKKAKKPKK